MVTAYPDERAIQTIIEQSPDLLPGITGTRVAVAAEFAIPGTGYVDIVGVGSDGSITVVECKLKANPEIRRHVIGQVFAYAAGIWGMAYDEFNGAFAERAGASLTERVASFAPPDWDEETFRAEVAENLSAGRFRLIIAVDQITDELERIVRYLNEHTNPTVQILAIELGYVAHDDVEILIPKVFGTEAVLDKAPSAGGLRWNEASFFATVSASTTAPGIEAMRRLFGFVRELGATMLWGNGPLPSVSALFSIGGKPSNLLSIYEWPKGTSSISVNFEYFAASAPKAALDGLVASLRNIPSFGPKLADLETRGFKKRPRLSVDDELCQPDVADHIQEALTRFLAGVKAS